MLLFGNVTSHSLALTSSVIVQAVVVIALVNLVWQILRRFFRLNGRLPPGPLGVPLLGYAPFLGPHPQLTITKLGEQYGSIFSFYLASQLTVVLNDLEAIRKCFVAQGDKVAERPTNFFLDLRAGGRYGITQANGEFWREQRRFAQRAFHELGAGRSRFEQLCLREVDLLISEFTQYADAHKPCFSRPLILHSYANVVGALCFGTRFERDDPLLARYVANIKGVSDLMGNAGLMQGFPILRHIPPWRSVWLYYKAEVANELALVRRACRKVETQVELSNQQQKVLEKDSLLFENNSEIGNEVAKSKLEKRPCATITNRQFSSTSAADGEDHDQTANGFVRNGKTRFSSSVDSEPLDHGGDENIAPQCLAEHFYRRRAWLEANGQQKLARTNYTDNQLYMMVVDIFGAATETSSNAMNWAILFLALNPRVQTQAFQQIADRVGLDRHVLWDDRFQLPYIEALLLETLRRGNQVPLGIARQPMCDIFVDGYLIPRDAMIVPNIWYIHSSEKYFDNPDVFEPERMLDASTGAVRTKDLPVLTFSVGKRSCIGAGIAKMDIFLFLANLLQKFEFGVCRQADGRPFPTAANYSTSINTSPRPYEVLIKLREKSVKQQTESKAGI